MKYVLFEAGKSEGKVVELESTLEEYYKLLNCDCIEMISRKFNNTYYDVIVDEEGLFKQNLVPTAQSYDENGVKFETIFGNMLVTKVNEEGDCVDLNAEDIKNITEKTSKRKALFQTHTGLKVFTLLQLSA